MTNLPIEQTRSTVRYQRWILVSAAMFAVAWGGNEFTPLLVMYKLEHGFSAVTVYTFLFAYVIGIVPALQICGPLSDRIGRRPVMLPAVPIAAIGSSLIALGPDSVALLFTGRVLTGVALGIGMAVGGTWLKELANADPQAGFGTGAKRAAMSLTSGFALGAGIAGVLAQWAPWPSHLAYLVHIAICVVVSVGVWFVPETRASTSKDVSLLSELKVPSIMNRRFLLIVAPVAPWVFGSASVAYALLPSLMADKSGGQPIALSALMSVVALGAGFATQSLARRIDTPTSARASITALLLLSAGMLVAAWAAAASLLGIALVAAVVLGCGYGMAMVAGLLEVQRIARADELAGLTAVFYSLSYLGFAIPAILSALTERWPGVITYPGIFAAGGVLAALCCLFVSIEVRRPHNKPRELVTSTSQ
ncbi:MFS transporter [Rhodococcus sp. 06-418-1B]|nr:MFS transporter [Rhodococcus sp. 06-418-1B]OZC92976.1 MFS transporter [Rhodococcus sp. 06-418-1B]